MEKINISFAGCGFLGFYHIGVASCIKEYAPHLLLNKISGASFGALAGCCALMDVSLGNFTSEILHAIYEIRKRPLGPFNPLINVQSMLRNILFNLLPKNAHEIVSGRLFISMTRVIDGSNIIVSKFKSIDHLIEVLLASAFVPLFSGFLPPKVGEYRYVDGGFSNNLPILDQNTITVSPFCGESDICPRDSSMQLFHINLYNTSVEVSKPNIYRFVRILFPPSPEALSQMCKQGFDDALKFLKRNDMISCTKCLTVQRTISLPISKHKKKDEIHHVGLYDPRCEECIHYIMKAASSKLPESILQNFDKFIAIANQELAGWIFRHKSMKLISVLTLPFLITADLIVALSRKLAESAPELMDQTTAFVKYLIELLMKTVPNMHQTGLFLASKVFEPLGISLYVNEERNNKSKEISPMKKGSIQFNFDSNITFNTLESDICKNEESFVVNSTEFAAVADDTHDMLLEAINHHEALMVFYYMDDSNKMNVIEFFDVTRDEKNGNTSSEEPENDITSDNTTGAVNACNWTSKGVSYVDQSSDEDNSVCSSADLNDEVEQMNISSDSESEWGQNTDLILNTGDPEVEQQFKRKDSIQTAIAIS